MKLPFARLNNDVLEHQINGGFTLEKGCGRAAEHESYVIRYAGYTSSLSVAGLITQKFGFDSRKKHTKPTAFNLKHRQGHYLGWMECTDRA